MDDEIGKFLGVKTLDEVVTKEIVTKTETKAQADPRKDEDFETARDMTKEILTTGFDALKDLAMIAQQSQNINAYEKLAGMMSTLSGASKTLMSIHKDKKIIDKVDLDNPDLADPRSVGNTNIIHVGSTAELQKFLTGMKL